MISLTVNGKLHQFDVEPEMPLLWALRENVALTGTKFGCGIAQCGTIEGLAPVGGLHPVQQAWIAEEVPQCGYCQSGQLLSAAALLASKPNPTDAQIDEFMAGNICRCGTYPKIRAAIHRASAMMRGGQPRGGAR
jgi:isoquinoline 1-oxidoreductase alpha subunit